MNVLSRVLQRFRYPVTLPQDITSALGIKLADSLTFDEFLHQLCTPSWQPSRLKRWMPRSQAEEAFSQAQRKERFGENSVFSYYFSQGWVIFILRFDNMSRLRNLELRHEKIEQENGVQIPLPT